MNKVQLPSVDELLPINNEHEARGRHSMYLWGQPVDNSLPPMAVHIPNTVRNE